MEPRARHRGVDQASGRYTLHVGCQGVFGMKGQLVDILGVPPDKVRVLTGNVGGSFGMKAAVYPEYVPILHAAKELGRPVKWTAERSRASCPTITAATTNSSASSRSTRRASSSPCASPASATSAPISARSRR